MTDIRIENLTMRYGDKTVLQDLCFTLPVGARIALMGPSGCGKTTLLRLLMGLQKPSGGRITGRPSRFSAVFQEDLLCEELSALDNIRLVLPHKKEKARILDMLASLGLAGEENTLASDLSGGMRRRVAIARALLAEGEALFLDEPFKGLDEDTRAQTAATICAAIGNRTVLLVTHDAREAELLGAAVVTDLFA